MVMRRIFPRGDSKHSLPYGSNLMNDASRRIWLVLIGLGAAAGLYYGWRLFWFQTDDAYIAFRYVSNSMLGHGYVWNAPPFKPVEGYTSFLWVVLLDGTWRLFGVEPPNSSDWLTLFFSAVTLWMIARVVWKMKLGATLDRFRPLFLALVLLGTLTNRTFLAWTSSGLETAMFNCVFTGWMILAWRFDGTRPGRTALLATVASLVYLTRPDGLLMWSATCLLGLVPLFYDRERPRPTTSHWLSLSPLLIPVLHVAWRLATYGEWLPNTFYAKHVDAWPEAGVRYVASFILEYGLVVWIIALILVLARIFKRRTNVATAHGSARWRGWLDKIPPAVVLLAVAGQVGYYTLIIGGDHFEYRVYSYLVPWIMVSFLWMLNRLTRDWMIATTTFVLFILLSWPLPWTHWALTQKLTTRLQTQGMKVPVAKAFPAGLRWYAETFDDLQSWLIGHLVCMRHQEHKIFQIYLASKLPERSYETNALTGEYPIMAYGSIGVPGWVFPRVSIIDKFGLNDYVIARHAVPTSRERKMAHDRYPPLWYIESWAVNYGFMENGTTGFVGRDYDLTADEILANERYWIDRVVHGSDEPMPYDMLCRIGETFVRMGKAKEAEEPLRKAVAMEPSKARGLVGLATDMTNLGKVDSARVLLAGALELEPDNPLILARLGTVVADSAYGEYGRDSSTAEKLFTRATELLQSALKYDSCRAEAMIELASMRIFTDELDESHQYLQRLESCPPFSPRLAQLLGERYLRKGDHDAAMRAFSIGINNGLDISQTRALLTDYPELDSLVANRDD